MTTVAITPALGRRILRSAEENGDSLTDLTRLTAMMAVAYQTTLTVEEARASAAQIGKQFTADGDLIVECDQR